jgi:dCTP deaminase
MILSDNQIQEARHDGHLVITPFDMRCLNANSYDVHLGSTLARYDVDRVEQRQIEQALDVTVENKVFYEDIPAEYGRTLYPGTLYLGVTQEYTETHRHVPFLDGKSSLGRLGLFIHVTAGRGDVGFCGHWTLEMVVVHPLRVFAGMPIGQLIYFESGKVSATYGERAKSKYQQEGFQKNPIPVPSMMFRNFQR